MFTKKEDSNAFALRKEIDALHLEMYTMNRNSSEYADALDLLTRLYALKEDNSKNRLSKDTLAVVVGNLAGILMIVGHEKAHVVTSKALGFVMKAR
jgi:hypothetical protein